jgi:hypothetical protein
MEILRKTTKKIPSGLLISWLRLLKVHPEYKSGA